MRCDWRVLLAATGLLSAVANASKGDRDPLFRDCVARCVQTGCASLRQPAERTRGQMCDTVCSGTKPAYLCHWSCEHDCAYHCMWIREELGATTGEGSMKYNGKWPFRRVAGLQELFSVVFSLGNLVAHVHMLRAFTRYMEAVCAGRWRRLYPYWWLWVLHSGVAANAWVWSAVFHCRDLRWTERLDYVSAIAVVFTGLFTALCRALTPGWGWRAGALAACCFGGMAVHLRHMLAVRFDYGWNMKVCVAAALATCAAWLLWAWRTRHPARSTLTAALLAVNLALLLELFDFPPLAGLLDAHSLWHAATIPLVYVWYAFVFQDVQLLARTSRDS